MMEVVKPLETDDQSTEEVVLPFLVGFRVGPAYGANRGVALGRQRVVVFLGHALLG